MILLQVVIISLLVFAIHYTMQSGEIFGFVSDWWHQRLDAITQKSDFLMSRIYEIENDTDCDKYDAHLLVEYRTQADRLLKRVVLFEKISQPIFSCPVCMAPWYGTVLYWLIPWSTIGLPAHNWVAWLVIIICCLGLNSIIVRTFKQEDE